MGTDKGVAVVEAVTLGTAVVVAASITLRSPAAPSTSAPAFFTAYGGQRRVMSLFTSQN